MTSNCDALERGLLAPEPAVEVPGVPELEGDDCAKKDEEPRAL